MTLSNEQLTSEYLYFEGFNTLCISISSIKSKKYNGSKCIYEWCSNSCMECIMCNEQRIIEIYKKIK